MADLPLKIIQNSQKQMPCNIEAEQALIGSILVSNDIYDEITLIAVSYTHLTLPTKRIV